MSLSIGIVGLPNVGKSTLFNALTKNNVLAANYPFATIEPNVGVVGVPDERLAKLAEIFGSEKILPAALSFVDIAGIVKGASEGAGLGNKFLANIRETDANSAAETPSFDVRRPAMKFPRASPIKSPITSVRMATTALDMGLSWQEALTMARRLYSL